MFSAKRHSFERKEGLQMQNIVRAGKKTDLQKGDELA